MRTPIPAIHDFLLGPGWLSAGARLGLVLAVSAAAWTAVYAVGALDLHLALRRYVAVGYGEMLREFIPAIVAWTLLTPAVLWLHRERRFTEGRRSRASLEHLGLSLLFTVCLGTVEILRLLWRLELPLTFFGDVWLQHSNLRMLQHAANYWGVIAFALFLDFYRSVRSGERQARVLRSQLAEARLSALRAKLQPHFLFNTFNSIASLVRSAQNARAVSMIADVSSLLRRTLESDHLPEVSLRAELELIDCYLQIEKARFQDRFTYERAVDAECLEVTVPNLILQPLVENAIKHGISRLTTPGTVSLRAHRLDDELRLDVVNTCPPETDRTEAPVSLGIGLSTTRDRLERVYGPRGRLLVQPGREGVFRVTLILPFRRNLPRAP
jgi:two-component system, LytTR family, sensor kinase